ncbi:MAG TPA: chitosanase [Polyangia bacterium]|nr:chitosanase [Polyangia bacterium]
MRRFAIAVLAVATGCVGTAPGPQQNNPNGPSPDLASGGPAGPSSDLGPANPGSPDLASPLSSGGPLTANQKAVAEAMTSIWENDTPKLDYAYSENINDGRGYTSGRAGFCTGTGDAIQVIACYDQLRTAANGNLMAKYMPALTTINNQFMSTGQDQGDTSALDAVGNWISDWGASYNTAATQADFKSCQDQISDLLYYTPAMQAAAQYGLSTALTKAALYDMWINQGDDTLVKQTNSALGVSGKIGGAITEDAWLKKFLELRRDLLAGDSTWKTSVDRVAGYEKARRRANWDLSAAVDSAVKAKQCWPTGNYLDSQYTAYVINPDATWATTSAAAGCQ